MAGGSEGNYMKTIGLAILLFLAGMQADQMMVAPKVTRETKQTVSEFTVTTRTCPAGYEGHFVDEAVGFNSESSMMYWGDGGPPVFTICFKTEFMDGVRKNPDMSAVRPQPPRAVWDSSPYLRVNPANCWSNGLYVCGTAITTAVPWISITDATH
jgi:hypothetical protein